MRRKHPVPDLWERAQSGDAQACFDLGLRYNREGRLRRGRRWLERSAAHEHPGACCELGLVYLHGLGVDPNPHRALQEFERARNGGSAAASFHLANLQYAGLAITPDRESARRELLAAAEGGHGPAMRLLGIVDRGSRRRTWLTAAKNAGDARAHELLDALPPRDAPATSDSSLRGWRWPDPEPPATERLAVDPPVERFAGAIDPLECLHLIRLAEPSLSPSLTIDPMTGAPVRHPIRTSSGTSLPPTMEDIAVTRVRDRLARLAGLKPECAESFALLRYEAGEEYRPHHDYIDENASEDRYRLREYGQRVATAFCYLSDVAAGGETDFPAIGLRVRPKLGDVLSFRNVDAAGQPDERSLHASLPVVEGTKWLATLWFRERALAPADSR